MKRKRFSERYSVLVVPRNHSTVRRVEFSRFTLLAWTVFAFLVLLGVIAMGAGLLHYRRVYVATEQVRVDAAKFQQERASLTHQLQSLGEAFERTERLAAHMGKDNVSSEDASSRMGPIGDGVLPPLVWRGPKSVLPRYDLSADIDELTKLASEVEGELHTVFSEHRDSLFLWTTVPTDWPTRGWISSEYGERRQLHGLSNRHAGIDIASPRGTPIRATADGVVIFSGYRQGYGHAVIVDHGGGIATLYGHCSKLFAREGTDVKRGDVIANIGNTGRSSGPHLHYEIHVNGIAVNPIHYIVDRS